MGTRKGEVQSSQRFIFDDGCVMMKRYGVLLLMVLVFGLSGCDFFVTSSPPESTMTTTAGGIETTVTTKTDTPDTTTADNETTTGYMTTTDVSPTTTLPDTTVSTEDTSTQTETSPKTFTISFETNGGSAVSSMTVEEGTIIDGLTVPEKEDYVFSGWFLDEDLTTALPADYVIDDNLTLYAAWETELTEYTITYYLDGGTQAADNPSVFTEDTGDIILAEPKKDGYVFLGWYETEWFFNDSVGVIPSGSTEDWELYARWIEEYMVNYVSFDTGGAPAMDPVVVYDGSKVTLPEVGTWADHVFLGWYEDPSFTEPWDDENQVTEDITLYAKWAEQTTSYTLSYYMVDRVMTPIEHMLDEGDAIVEVFGGYQRALVLTEHGKLYSFGRNEFGETGTGSSDYAVITPMDIAPSIGLESGSSDVEVWMGRHHTIINVSGTLYGFGRNGYGQIGPDEANRQATPIIMNGYLGLEDGEGILDLVAGSTYTMILTSDHRVMTYGYVPEFQLYDEEDFFKPQDVTYQFVLNEGENIIDIVDMMFLTDQGRLLAYGNDFYWQTGNEAYKDIYDFVSVTPAFNISGAETIDRIKETAGRNVMFTSTGRILLWGVQHLGLDESYYDDGVVYIEYGPVTDISGWFDAPIADLEFGDDFGVALMENGSIYTWGDNLHGVLGDSRITHSFTPHCVDDWLLMLEDDTIVSVETSSSGVFALSEKGNLYAWGDIVNGQLATANHDGMDPFVLFAETPYELSLFDESQVLEYADIEALEGPEDTDWYTFVGWFTDETLTTRYDFKQMPQGDLTVYGGYEFRWYTIDYELDGGENHDGNRSWYNYFSYDIVFYPPTKEGYTFGGWYDNPDFTGEAITALPEGYHGDVTLYAKWTENA